jgi:hypothetical protein
MPEMACFVLIPAGRRSGRKKLYLGIFLDIDRHIDPRGPVCGDFLVINKRKAFSDRLILI